MEWQITASAEISACSLWEGACALLTGRHAGAGGKGSQLLPGEAVVALRARQHAPAGGEEHLVATLASDRLAEGLLSRRSICFSARLEQASDAKPDAGWPEVSLTILMPWPGLA